MVKMVSIFFSSVKKNNSLLKIIASFCFGNLGISIIGASSSILTARYVDPAVNGYYRMFTIPLMYLIFLQLGIFQGIQREIPYYIGRNQHKKVNDIASIAGAWAVIIAGAVSLFFFICALRAAFLHNTLHVAGWLAQVIVCWNIYYGLYLSNTFRTKNHFIVVLRIEFIQAIFSLVLVAILPLFQFYGLCLKNSLPLLLSLWFFHKNRPLKVPLKFNYTEFKELIKIGAPLCFWTTIKFSFWPAIESSFILYFCGVKGLGLFSVAVMYCNSISSIPQAVFQILKPRIAEAYGRQGNMYRELKQYCLISFLLSLGLSIVIFSLSYFVDYYIPIILPKYTDAIPLVNIYSWNAVMYSFSIPLNGLFATGKSWLFGKGILAGFIIFIVFVYLMFPIIGGMLAVAIGSLIGNAIWIIIGYVDIVKLIRQKK